MKDTRVTHYLWKYAIKCTIEDIRMVKGHYSSIAAIRKIKLNSYKSIFSALIIKLSRKLTLSKDEQSTLNNILEITNRKEISQWVNEALSTVTINSPSSIKEEEPEEIKSIQSIQFSDQSSTELNINLDSASISAKLHKSAPINIIAVQGIWGSFKDISRVMTITVQVDKLLNSIIFSQTQSDYFMKVKLKSTQTIQSHINSVALELVNHLPANDQYKFKQKHYFICSGCHVCSRFDYK